MRSSGDKPRRSPRSNLDTVSPASAQHAGIFRFQDLSPEILQHIFQIFLVNPGHDEPKWEKTQRKAARVALLTVNKAAYQEFVPLSLNILSIKVGCVAGWGLIDTFAGYFLGTASSLCLQSIRRLEIYQGCVGFRVFRRRGQGQWGLEPEDRMRKLSEGELIEAEWLPAVAANLPNLEQLLVWYRVLFEVRANELESVPKSREEYFQLLDHDSNQVFSQLKEMLSRQLPAMHAVPSFVVRIFNDRGTPEQFGFRTDEEIPADIGNLYGVEIKELIFCGGKDEVEVWKMVREQEHWVEVKREQWARLQEAKARGNDKAAV